MGANTTYLVDVICSCCGSHEVYRVQAATGDEATEKLQSGDDGDCLVSESGFGDRFSARLDQ